MTLIRLFAVLVIIGVGVLAYVEPPPTPLGSLVSYLFGLAAGFWFALTYLARLYGEDDR